MIMDGGAATAALGSRNAPPPARSAIVSDEAGSWPTSNRRVVVFGSARTVSITCKTSAPYNSLLFRTTASGT